MRYQNINTLRRASGGTKTTAVGVVPKAGLERSARVGAVMGGGGADGGNATSRVNNYLERGDARRRAWADKHLSVEAVGVMKPEPQAPSFPPAPRDLRALLLRKGLGGAHRP